MEPKRLGIAVKHLNDNDDFPEYSYRLYLRYPYSRLCSYLINSAISNKKPRIFLKFTISINTKSSEDITLVSPFGCEKFTTISLLSRLYSLSSGSVLIDSIYITSIHISQYHADLALISQERILVEPSSWAYTTHPWSRT
ncbi:MAG: hypothetical protein M1822_001263 [Bathelium mastoideum]|nr:MAG: hypothetical protein M1822_001263 [Bathelium mastoideum]